MRNYILGHSLPKTMFKGVIQISRKMNDSYMMCIFSLLESRAFDGERGRRGFVIEVKNNKATTCWPTLCVQRPWYESNALCMPLRTSRDTGKHVAFDPAFFLLSFIWPILQNCHQNSCPRQSSANLTLRGYTVFSCSLPLLECSWTFLLINLQRTEPRVFQDFHTVHRGPSGSGMKRTFFCCCYLPKKKKKKKILSMSKPCWIFEEVPG